MTDLVLLLALLGGPAYGYSLKKTAGLIFGSGAIHNNLIYPTLKKFERNGWVEQTAVPGSRGQQRKQYRITRAGRKYLLGEIRTFGGRQAGDEGAFLLRIAMFDVLSPRQRRGVIAARRSFLAERSAELSQLRGATPPESFRMVALGRVLNRIADELRWIEEIESREEIHRGGSHAAGQV
jgi:DNA-binding PadR family transcriptional regulator